MTTQTLNVTPAKSWLWATCETCGKRICMLPERGAVALAPCKTCREPKVAMVK